MTENQWSQTTPSADEDPRTATVPSGDVTGSASKKDAAKDEAADVKRQAADSAQTVAGTAKTEAANVATEAKTSARNLLQQAKSDLTDQAGTQQQKAAEGVRALSSQLSTMADASEQPGVAADLVRQAAERSQSVASWLENRDPGSLLDEVKSFARQRPGTFLLAAAGAGLLAGRLGRSLQAGAPNTQQSTSRPTQLSSPAVAPANRFFDEPALAGTAGPVSTQTLPSGTAADSTLRDNVPFPNREGGQL